MKLLFLRLLKWICLIYVALCAASFIVFTFSNLEAFNSNSSLRSVCYITDAMLPYVECEGVKLAWLYKIIYNIWYIPVYGILGFKWFPIGTMFGCLVLSPFIFTLCYFMFLLVKKVNMKLSNVSKI